MYKNKSFLAVIPARAGSKRLPGKNLKELAGKPLICWTIDAASGSGFLDRIIVSTDSEEIAAVAEKAGAEVPFMRPPELATDIAGTVDVVLHAVEEIWKTGCAFDYIVLLQPTSPLRTSDDIDSAIQNIISSGKDALISVCPTEHPAQWMNTLPYDLSMDNFLPEKYRVPSTQLDPTYRINGAFYIISAITFKKYITFFPSKNTIAFIMDKNKSVDIDDEMDFKFAEVLFGEK